MFTNLTTEVVQRLVLTLRTVFYMPSDYVVVAGEYGDEMFFVKVLVCAAGPAGVSPCDVQP